MKFKKNIFKMIIHSAIPILISLTLLILYLIFIKSIDITFYIILVILLGSIVSQSKFLYILILFIGDVIGNKVVKEEILLNAIVDNNDLEFIGAKRKYTLFDLLDNNYLMLCDLYTNKVYKLRYYGDKNDFKKHLYGFVQNIAYPKVRFGKIIYVLRHPGKHKLNVCYYKNSKIIKCFFE